MTAATLETTGREMIDLAPGIHRQRLVVEGLVDEPIGPEQIESYLAELSGVLGMTTVLAPITHESERFGWAGWIHWETSGAHFYAWDVPRLFFSVDVYACKPFAAQTVVDLTREWFDSHDVVYKEF